MSKAKTSTRRAVLRGLALGTTALAAFPKISVAQAKTGKIGVLAQMTGNAANVGIGVQHAVEIARQELKDKGVIDLQVFYEDNQQQASVGVVAFQKMIDQHGITAVMANFSPINLALNPIGQERKVLVYNFDAISPALRKLAPWTINGCSLADRDGGRLADFILKRGNKTVGMLIENNEFGVAVADFFANAFKKGGGQIIAHEVNDPGKIDSRTQLLKIKAANPSALLIIRNIPENGYAVAQAKEVGINLPIYSNLFLLSPDNFKVAGAAMNGAMGIAPKFDPASPNAKDFVAKFNEKAGRAPTASDAQAYDGARLLGEAIAAKGPSDAMAVRNYIVAVKDWPGASGNFNFDQDGAVNLPFYYYRVVDGKAVFNETGDFS